MANDPNELILMTSKRLGFDEPSAVEKDLYVTKVLHALSDIKSEHFQLVFIGGTCLAKAHRIVDRMSEDIDFKLVPISEKALNNKAARKEMSVFREEILKCIEEHTGLAPKENQVIKGNNNKFTQIFLDYPSSYPTNSALRQQIKVELTAQKINTPIEYLPVNSLIYGVFGKDSGMDVKTIACISLDETAAEKWAALNRRVADVERRGINPENSIIRHLFDLHAIQEKRGITKIFEKLVPDVVLRDRERFKGKSPHFFENTLEEIAFGTKALNQNIEWQKRYQHFIGNMVFEKNCPTFKDALKTLDTLNERAFGAIDKSKIHNTLSQ